tara:strand:- start:1148 stop:2395 length:1248 start_codon:yes stop_codon:yes gene_type:complete
MLLLATAVMIVLVVSFLCSIFESVLLSVRRPHIEMMRRNGQQAGELLAKFRQNMDRPIAAILILNTAAHTVGASVAGASYTDAFSGDTLWLFSLIFTIAVLLFTEIIPKTLGVNYSSRLAEPVAYGIQGLTILLQPLVRLSEKISGLMRRDKPQPVTSADEIRLLAFLGGNEGAVGRNTASMVVGATQLRHLQARDVMLPRDEISFLSVDMDRHDVVARIRDSGHSRFPFSATGELNDINGVVFAKELLSWLLENDGIDIDWDALCHESLVVPESAALPSLLNNFQSSRRHLALVVDEYGSVRGLVTLEDVLEEIVGDILDEHDLFADDYTEHDDGTHIVRASVDLRKLSAKLGIPWNPELEVASVGGLVTETLERIPKAGDSIDWNGFRIEVLRADRRRARVLRVSPIKEPSGT